ncbi:MAG: signal peptidase I [Aggregatilineales bacterium]
MLDSAAAVPWPRPRLRQRGFLHEIAETIFLIAAIYALVDLASVRFYVDGPSMEPSFFTGQRIIVSRVSYLLGEPERGDIIVFESPDNPAADPPLIKRLIGLPGDTVEIRQLEVYVNGVLLNEPYFVNGPCTALNCPDNRWTLGPNEYFVMGDNRNRSRDSRRFGPITREHIIGEALVRYWPPADWGIVEHYRFAP